MPQRKYPANRDNKSQIFIRNDAMIKTFHDLLKDVQNNRRKSNNKFKTEI